MGVDGVTSLVLCSLSEELAALLGPGAVVKDMKETVGLEPPEQPLGHCIWERYFLSLSILLLPCVKFSKPTEAREICVCEGVLDCGPG